MVSVPSAGSTSTRTCSFARTLPVGAHRRCAGPVAVDRRGTCASRSRAPRPAANTTSRHGRATLADRDGLARLRRARAELVARRLEVDGRLARRGVVQRELDDAVVASRGRSTRAIAGARELGAAHHLEHPADLLPDDDGGEPSPARRPHDLRRARGAVVERDEVYRARSPGSAIVDHAGAVDRRRGSRRRSTPAGASISSASVRERVVGQRLADVARLLVAHPHRLDDLVVRCTRTTSRARC